MVNGRHAIWDKVEGVFVEAFEPVRPNVSKPGKVKETWDRGLATRTCAELNRVETLALNCKLTLLIYLNEGYSGGDTVFSEYEYGEGAVTVHSKRVTPQTGLILIFRHELKHEGEELVKGRKYVLRTDVMYAKS